MYINGYVGKGYIHYLISDSAMLYTLHNSRWDTWIYNSNVARTIVIVSTIYKQAFIQGNIEAARNKQKKQHIKLITLMLS